MTITAADLWSAALLAIPLALGIALICRLLPCRPSTRHFLWLLVLVAPVILPFLPERPDPSPSARALPAPVMAVVLDSSPAPEPRASIVPSASPPRTMERRTAPSDARTLTSPEPIRAPQRDSNLTRTLALNLALTRAPSIEIAATRPPATTWTHADEPRQDAPMRPTGDADEAPALTATTTMISSAPLPPTAFTPVPGAAAPVRTVNSTWALSSASAAFATVRTGVVSSIREYIEKLTAAAAAIRDGIFRVPALPRSIWLIGAAVCALFGTGRVLAFRARMHAGDEADSETVELVRSVGAGLGLRRLPRVRMTEAPISPMVWCGGRVELLLPTALWNELDDVGRRAVICHELAHLRRRDHLVCWIAMIMGCLYWWHPVVWWARRRIDIEADLCCDAWVTNLLPHARRAYATALLDTKRFALRTPTALPAVGLACSTIRAERFARRLTMVMTQHVAPRLTFRGLALGMLVGTVAWLSSPLLACDPCPPASPEPAAAPTAATIPRFSAEPYRPNVATFEAYMQAAGHDEDAEDHPRSMEERIERIERTLERLMDHLESNRQVPRTFTVPSAPPAPGVNQRGLNLPRQGYFEGESDEQISRTYKLSRGKLKDLTDLMSRSDVPILITPENNAIVLHGTAAEHRTFAAFVRMIDPDGPSGKKAAERALTEPMERASKQYFEAAERLVKAKEILERRVQGAADAMPRDLRRLLADKEKGQHYLDMAQELAESASDRLTDLITEISESPEAANAVARIEALHARISELHAEIARVHEELATDRLDAEAHLAR